MPAVRHDAYLALESSLADRLVKGWRKISGPFLRSLWGHIQSGDFVRARETARSINLEPVLRANMPYIRYITQASLLFGATRITDDAEQTEIAQDHRASEDAADRAREILVAGVLHNVEEAIRIHLLALIEQAATVEKFDPDQPRDNRGRWTDGEQLSLPGMGVEDLEKELLAAIGNMNDKRSRGYLSETEEKHYLSLKKNWAEVKAQQVVQDYVKGVGPLAVALPYDKIPDDMKELAREFALVHERDRIFHEKWGERYSEQLRAEYKVTREELKAINYKGEAALDEYIGPEYPYINGYYRGEEPEVGAGDDLYDQFFNDRYSEVRDDGDLQSELQAKAENLYPDDPDRQSEYVVDEIERRADKEAARYAKEAMAQYVADKVSAAARTGEQIEDLIAKIPPVPADTLLYRGVARVDFLDWDSLNPGDTVQMEGFTSTTTDPGVAQQFGKYTLKIVVPDGSRDVLFTENDPEREVILNHGARLRVLGRSGATLHAIYDGRVTKADRRVMRVNLGRMGTDPKSVTVLKFDESQPRVPAGQPGGGQWTKDGSGAAYNAETKTWMVDGKAMAAADQGRLKALRVPPAWVGVRLNPDLTGALQAVGKDSKGRSQYLYSAAHTEKAAAEKFARLREFNAKVPVIKDTSLRDMRAGSTQEDRDTAAVVQLIAKTGFRIGGDGDAKTKHTAYGASTLLGHHVKVNGDKLVFSFVAKKGVRINKTIEDAELAGYIRGVRPEKGKPLFQTDDARVREYFKRIAGADFKVKDLRTWQGTAKAIEKASKLRPPKNEKEFKKWRREIAVSVSNHLGNTPTVALASYIDPSVFKPYHEKWGVKKIDSFDTMQDLMNEYFETTHFVEDRMILPWQIVVDTAIDPDDNDQDEIYVVEKYDEDQPRDENGRWSSETGWAPGEAVYHGTAASLVHVILKEGLKPGERWFGRDPAVYAATSEERALMYAVNRANKQWFEGPDRDKAAIEGVVLKIRYDKNKFKPDTEEEAGKALFTSSTIDPKDIIAYRTYKAKPYEILGKKNVFEAFKETASPWHTVSKEERERFVYVFVFAAPKVQKYDENQPRDEDGKWVTSYHGTAEYVLDKIKKEGLRPQEIHMWQESTFKNKGVNRDKSVWATMDLKVAALYARHTEKHPDFPTKAIIIELRIPKQEWESKWKVDELDTRGGSRRLEGVVPPEYIVGTYDVFADNSTLRRKAEDGFVTLYVPLRVPVVKKFDPDQPRDEHGRWTSITDRPEFKAWFGKSKVVDEDGKPLVVYHGTATDNEGVFMPDVGVSFFSPSPDTASNFANMKSRAAFGQPGEGAHVVPVYLSLQKPFDHENPKHVALAKDFIRNNADGGHWPWSSVSELRAAIRAGDYSVIEDPEFLEMMLDNGFDGFIVRESEGGNANYGVFDNRKIKSAIGNTTFDPNSQDITKFDPDQPRDELGRWIPLQGPQDLKDSLGIPRSEMPQIKWKHYDELVEFAEGKGVSIDSDSVLANTLKPAQNEYNPHKMRFVEKDKLQKPVIISKDGYVLDGTHRWLYFKKNLPQEKIKVRRISLDAKEALKLMHSFPKAFRKDIHGEVQKYHHDQPRDDHGRWTALLDRFFGRKRRPLDKKRYDRYEDWMVAVLGNWGDEIDTDRFHDGDVQVYDRKGYPLAFWDGYEGYAYMPNYSVKKLAKIQDFTSFAESANSEAEAMLQLTSSLHTSRLSAYGFLVEAKVKGYSQYQISAQLDKRACEVCKYMDGKVFEIDDLDDSLEEIFSAKSPDDLATIQEWPGQGKADLDELYGLSDSEIVERNWNLPPWHPGCRCLCVVVGSPELPKNTPSYQQAQQDIEFSPPKSVEEVPQKELTKIVNRLDGLSGPHALAVWEDLADEFGDDVLEELTGLTEEDILLGAKLDKKKFPFLFD